MPALIGQRYELDASIVLAQSNSVAPFGSLKQLIESRTPSGEVASSHAVLKPSGSLMWTLKVILSAVVGLAGETVMEENTAGVFTKGVGEGVAEMGVGVGVGVGASVGVDDADGLGVGVAEMRVGVGVPAGDAVARASIENDLNAETPWLGNSPVLS